MVNPPAMKAMVPVSGLLLGAEASISLASPKQITIPATPNSLHILEVKSLALVEALRVPTTPTIVFCNKDLWLLYMITGDADSVCFKKKWIVFFISI